MKGLIYHVATIAALLAAIVACAPAYIAPQPKYTRFGCCRSGPAASNTLKSSPPSLPAAYESICKKKFIPGFYENLPESGAKIR